MDTLTFQISNTSKDNINGVVAVPFINGHSLIDLIKEIEIQYEPSIAGAYDGLRPDHLISELMVGSMLDTTKSKILECECGVDGCWSLLITVIKDDTTVTWTNFSQVHRDNWDYSSMKDFKFDRAQYEAALRQLKQPAPNNG